MSRREILGNYAVLALGVITFATTVFAVWQHFSPLPYGDSWDGSIGFYMRAAQDPWHAFFEQHNEHRLTFSRLIFFADIRYFGGRNVFSLISNLVLAGALAAAFFRITVHYRPTLSRQTRFGLAGAILVFAFSWMQRENFAWGFQSQWFAVYLFALLAFHSIDRTAEADAGDKPAKRLGWLTAALVSAWFAAYSMSSGVLVFPALIVQALYARLKPRQLLAIVIVTVAVWFAYFIDWHKPGSSGNLLTGVREHPLAAIRYVLLYLGSPAFQIRTGLAGAYVAGILVLAALAANCFRLLRASAGRPQGVALLVFALFIAGNALLTASGRLWFGVETALASRYTTASLMGWLALILFAALNSRTPEQLRRAVFVAALATLAVASGQRFFVRADRDETYARFVAGLALRAHVYDPEIIRPVYPFPDALPNIARQAEAEHLSIFAPDQPDYLVPPSQINASLPCAGSIDDISATTTPGTYRATGWIYDQADKRTPRAIVVTDATGTTLGTGVIGAERGDVRNIFGRSARYSGWTAFFKAPASGGIRVDGQTAAGAYCALQAEKPMPAALPAAAAVQ
ncbi:hypothetical protein E2553_09540 [Paraburkholderia dipogonis]|uniref:Transmembrane protein n=1 Tax=Paraburkholderia dipogonis TaxID=1211383 RepID=A0A4Y8N628_9BURK|nr:hypothetical protein [Paraburkholderia dipogonis]TFE45230.1 hypothetical protein E2553_09540 [Paraburkholderia dipogonis]